jgi:alpha-galactosidase
VAPDGSEALVSVVATKIYANEAPIYIRFRGLLPDRFYLLDGRRYLGGALMYAGFRMPEASQEYQSWNFHFVLEQL